MQKRFIPLTVFFVVMLVLLAHFGERLITTVSTFSFADERREVYLTFDDGPSTVVTSKILDILKEEDVKATFFIVSDRVAGREEVLRRIANEGHTLGVHSKSHVYSEIYKSDETLLKDIDACAAVIKKVTGVVPNVYRFPGGGTTEKARQTKLVEEHGYRVVGWNSVCGDEEIPHASADVLVQTSVKTSKNKQRVVLLCHDSAYRKETAEALPKIIESFREQGYVFCAF